MALHRLYNTDKNANEATERLRKTIRNEGVEPLATMSLIAFIQEAQKRGIKKIIMPNNFVMQYAYKVKDPSEEIPKFITDEEEESNMRKMIKEGNLSEEKLKERIKEVLGKDEKQEDISTNEEQKADSIFQRITLNRINTALTIIKHSKGIKILEIPDGGYDNFSINIEDAQIDIRDFYKRGNTTKTGEDPRRKQRAEDTGEER